MNVFDPDYVANSSPFSLTDVTSKAAQLGIRSQKGHTHNWERRNPNVVRKNRRKWKVLNNVYTKSIHLDEYDSLKEKSMLFFNE